MCPILLLYRHLAEHSNVCCAFISRNILDVPLYRACFRETSILFPRAIPKTRPLVRFELRLGETFAHKFVS